MELVYFDYEVNEAVHNELVRARDMDWIRILKDNVKKGIRHSLTRGNIFPSHEKIFGSFHFKSVWFNIMILAVQAFFLNVITIWKLRHK